MKSGKAHEQDILKSCEKDNIFAEKNRDIFIPPEVRKEGKVKTPPQKYDYVIFNKPFLLTCELKQTKQKSIRVFDEKIIKQSQINSLVKASKYDGVIAGFIFTFAGHDNKTFFIDINDFLRYKEETDRKSMSLDDCQEIGIEIDNQIKVKRYKYNIKGLFDKLNEIYN